MLPKGLLKEYSHGLSFAIGVIDMLVVFSISWAAFLVRFGSLHLPPHYLTSTFIASLITPFVFNLCHIYVSQRGEHFYHHALRLTEAICLLAFIMAGLAFFTKSGESYSRTWFVFWMFFSLLVLIAYRQILLLFLRMMRTKGWNERKVVIFGAGELGAQFATSVQQALWTGFKITAFIDDHADEKPKMINKIPVIATPAQLSTYLSRNKIDEFWLALPLREEERVRSILHELRHHTITTRFVLDIFGLDLLNHSISELAGFPVLNIRSTPMMGINRLLKAIEDRLIALTILVFISPLLFIIAIAIKADSKGPILFKQNRLGWDGRIINVYKFRTMYQHDDEGVTQASQQDARVTKVGRFLRKTSLDELPQFINVMQGRMSIVGPRPHALAHNEQYKDLIRTYMQRHRVKPGITGWAQINGWRGETDTLDKMEKRVEYDLYYINNWSLGFDLKIIFLTFFKGFVNKNAY